MSLPRYNKRKSVRHGFLDGLSGWMSDGSSGGSLTTESTGGGRATLSTGTAAENDSGRVDLDPITPNASDQYDAVSLRVAFSLADGARSKEDATIQMGYLNASNLNRIYHQPNHGNPDRVSTLRLSVSDTDTIYQTREKLSSSVLESELIWDTSTDELIHLYQDCVAQRVTETGALPDPTLDYEPKISITTKNTSQDRVMYVHEIEVAYYNRPNTY